MMRLERVVLVAGGGCMTVGAIAGATGLILRSDTWKLIAVTALAGGVLVGCIPLAAAALYLLFKKLRPRDR
jgi:hypothetical protein